MRAENCGCKVNELFLNRKAFCRQNRKSEHSENSESSEDSENSENSECSELSDYRRQGRQEAWMRSSSAISSA